MLKMPNSPTLGKLLILLIALLISAPTKSLPQENCKPSQTIEKSSKFVKFVNHSQSDVSLHWVNSSGENLEFMNVKRESSRNFSRFHGHTFSVNLEPKSTSTCFTISRKQTQVIILSDSGNKLLFPGNNKNFDSSKTPFSGTAYIAESNEQPIGTNLNREVELQAKGVFVRKLRSFQGSVKDTFEVEEYHLSLPHYQERQAGLDDKRKHYINLYIATSIAAHTRERQAHKIKRVLTQLPSSLYVYTDSIYIFPGKKRFTANPQGKDIAISSQLMDLLSSKNHFPSALLHELSHNALDRRFAYHSDWLLAQSTDAATISQYAFDFPLTEDLAESFVSYYLIRCQPQWLSDNKINVIKDIIPNRIAFFDKHLKQPCF